MLLASARRPRSTLLALATVLALAATACSGGGGASPRAGRATTTAATVLAARVSGGLVRENEVTTFDVDGGALKVLVPIGAVTKGTEVQLREVTGAAGDFGAVQRVGRVYDLGFRGGSLRPNAKIALTFAAEDVALDPAPAGGRWDDGASAWQAAPVDASTSAVTVYATAPGRYTWLRWDWDRALQAGAAAVRSLAAAPSDATVRCTDSDAARARVDVAVTGDARSWCVGREGGVDVLHVANTAAIPMTVRTKGFGAARAVHEDAFASVLNAALAGYRTPPTGEQVRVLAPGDEIALPFDPAVTDARAVRLETNGIAQHQIAVLAAAVFAVGLHTGNAELVAPVMGDAALRATIVRQLAVPACAGALGAALDGATFGVDRLAAFAANLVRTCLDTDAVRPMEMAAMQRPAGSLRSSFPVTAPPAVLDRVEPALRDALAALVGTARGAAPAGEIDVSARGSGATVNPFTPAGEVPTVSASPTVPGVASTTPLAATTTTPAGGTATTPATAPASPTTPATTIARPATTAPAPPVTTPAPVPVPAPVTTPAPNPANAPLSFAVTGSTCATNGGGTLAASSAQFTPGAPWSVTVRSPSGAPSVSTGTARADGTIDWTFACAGRQAGTWTAQAAQGGRSTDARSFTVNVYDTRAETALVDLPLCSGAVTAQGDGSPAGSFRQTFLLGGRTTIGQIGIANREELRGVLRVRRDNDVLFSADVSGSGTNPIVVSGVGLTVDANPGDVLTLELAVTQATAAHLNLALNFWRTQADAAPGVEVRLDNSCPWNPRPSAASGTDLVAWILP